jgi:TRAP-type mannitol/chloroaromatic compound transport system substrate-binding protein
MTSARTRTNLNRRTLLAAAGSAGTALAAPAAVRAQGGVRELRMATAWPKGSAGLGANAQRLADMITAMSGGRLTVRVYAATTARPRECGFAFRAARATATTTSEKNSEKIGAFSTTIKTVARSSI